MVSSRRKDSSQSIWKHRKVLEHLIISKRFDVGSHEDHSFVDALRSVSCIHHRGMQSLKPARAGRQHESDDDVQS